MVALHPRASATLLPEIDHRVAANFNSTVQMAISTTGFGAGRCHYHRVTWFAEKTAATRPDNQSLSREWQSRSCCESPSWIKAIVHPLSANWVHCQCMTSDFLLQECHASVLSFFSFSFFFLFFFFCFCFVWKVEAWCKTIKEGDGKKEMPLKA